MQNAQSDKSKGNGSYQKDEVKDSITSYDKVIQINHDDPQIYFNKKIDLSQLVHNKGVLMYYDKPRGLKSDLNLPYCNKDVTFSTMGKGFEDKEKNDFDKLSELAKKPCDKNLNKNFVNYIEKTLLNYKAVSKNLENISQEILKNATKKDQQKILLAEHLIKQKVEEIIKNQIADNKRNNSTSKSTSLSQEEIIKELLANNQNLEIDNQFTKVMIMKLSEGIEKLEVNTPIVNCITDLVYNNELLNHPELLKLAAKKFGMTKALDLCDVLSADFVIEAIEHGSAELVLAGCISLNQDDVA